MRKSHYNEVGSLSRHYQSPLVLQDKIGEGSCGEVFRAKALSIANAMQAVPVVLESILGFAWLHLNNGDVSYAGELLGLVQNHPANGVEVQDRLDEMMPLLEDVLSSDDLQSAL